MADYGNSLYAEVKPIFDKLQYAIGNKVGQINGVECTVGVAKLMIAQSVSREAVSFTDRRKVWFKPYEMENAKGTKISMSNMVESISCRYIWTMLSWMVVNILHDIGKPARAHEGHSVDCHDARLSVRGDS